MTLLESIRKNALGLGLFAIFTAGVIVVTQSLTADMIEENQQQYRAKLLFEILPDATETLAEPAGMTNDPQFSSAQLLALKKPQPWYKDSQTGDVILPVVAPGGYTEAISLLVGISPQGLVRGVRIVSHKETPGLGDRVEPKKSQWIFQFDDKSLSQPAEDLWQVKKDGGAFDQLSGATITPRAIVRAVSHALEFYRENQQILLQESAINDD